MNISCPPTVNLLREIIVFCGLLNWSFYRMIGLSFLSFICAAYRLYLFSFTSHGEGVEKHVNWLVRSREYVLGVFHVVPLFVLIIKRDLFMV